MVVWFSWDVAVQMTLQGLSSSLQMLVCWSTLLIFISANPLNLLLVMVVRWLVLMSFSWLKLLSLSHDVIGKVRATRSKTCKFGNCKALQECKASTNLLGTSALAACCSFHFVIHMLYSVDNMTECGKSALYRSAAWASSVGRVPSFSTWMHSLGRRRRRPRAMEWDGLLINRSWSWEIMWERNSSNSVILK